MKKGDNNNPEETISPKSNHLPLHKIQINPNNNQEEIKVNMSDVLTEKLC